MAATSLGVTCRLLVNVNAFTNPSTREGPIVNQGSVDVVLKIEEGFGLSVEAGVASRPERHKETRKPQRRIQPLLESFF